MKFTFVTDYYSLKALKDKSLLLKSLLSRSEKLLEYDFEVVYRSGRKHFVPGFLSKIYLNEAYC